jgi:hypothetical protein
MDKQDLQIHQQFTEYGRNAREWMRKCVLLLPEIERRQIWKKRGCGSIFEYAAKLAGMSRATVEDGLRVMKKAEEFPALKAVVESRGVNRVKPIVSIITPETEKFWAEKAKEMSRHTLETYVQNYRSESRTGPANESVKFTMKLKPELVEKLKELKGIGTWDELMQKLMTGKQQDEAIPEAVKTSSRHIPARIERHVIARTGGLCAYPSCAREATSLHHTQRWGLEKVHDPARLHSLCDDHERLAHLGLIENEEAMPREWRVLEHPDLCADKHFIDQFVALYRPT